jgi:hypothetical protein
VNVDAGDLAARLTVARTAGFTCRAIASLANPDVPLEPGTDTWQLAGRVDRLSRGGAVMAEELKLLKPVLDRIEKGRGQGARAQRDDPQAVQPRRRREVDRAQAEAHHQGPAPARRDPHRRAVRHRAR